MKTCPQGRMTKMLGSNIRAGMTPGGMSTQLGTSRAKYRKRASNPSMEEVGAAATAALARRGIAPHIFQFDYGKQATPPK